MGNVTLNCWVVRIIGSMSLNGINPTAKKPGVHCRPKHRASDTSGDTFAGLSTVRSNKAAFELA
jgi:hypothetical protein